MIQAAMNQYHFVGQALLRPARDQLRFDHPIRVESFIRVVANNPFVRSGHERLYAEAFYAGFVGDMPKAISLVVHLIEQSIREVLVRAGVTVTILDSQGMQVERDLNTLLYEPRTRELLGDDLAFSLQALLVEKFGLDLRNEVSHGLVPYSDFFTYSAFYAWWLCMRFICVPLRFRQEPAETASNSDDAATG
jgi:hypothetical protein